MALPGFYKVNFTDPRKEGFIIEPYQTNGAISPVSPILDGSAPRADTSLLLYGRDVPNYGERVAENFVQLLENFAGPAQPQNPIEGQLWFDTGTIYTISAWSSADTVFFIGDLTDVFTGFATAQTVVQLSFKPVNSNIDNTFQSIGLKVKSAVSAGVGATSVTFTDVAGQPISLPATVVGGWVSSAAPGYSRMRVAAKSGGLIKWVDITNVLSSTEAPAATTLTIGDLWYDSATSQLKVYGTSGWASVAGRYLPLDGGTMNGVIQMGSNKIFSSGTITAVAGDLNALVNRKYVDGVQSDLQDQITDISDQLGGFDPDSVTGKVAKAGDQMTGALVFGDGSATASIARGIDANNYPIVKPLITWNKLDYITSANQTNYVVDKHYVGQAFAQHLLDEKHGAGGFIQIQPDGTGIFPNSVAFSNAGAGKSYTFSWYDVTGNNSHQMFAQYSGASSQLVLQAGTDASDTIDFRHSLQPVGQADPLFRVGATGNRSYQTLFLHDGQPQPTALGVPTAMNDDTAAASKGFVRQWVTDAIGDIDTGPTDPGSMVTSGSYAYNVTAKTYTLTLLQSGGSPVIVNEYHKHSPYDMDYFVQEVNDLHWSPDDPLLELLEEDYPTFPNITVGDMLRALNKFKAPIQGAIFNDTPQVGIEGPVVEYNSAAKTIRIEGDYAATLVAGQTGAISGVTANAGVYTIVSAVAGAANADGPTTVVTVLETLPLNGVETGDDIAFYVGEYVPSSNSRGLVTRSTLDTVVGNGGKVDYLYWKATSAGTNVVKALGFTYTPAKNKLWVFRNGQKLRVNTLTGGDFNETTSTTITIANVYLNDEFEIYEI